MGSERFGLRAMRRVATGTLLGLGAVYLVTFAPADPGWATRFLRAATGAGIVGALADWFAVVALFRHPLGLPVPHTALLPRNQGRVADAVGDFIQEHFLDPRLILAKLRDLGLAARLSAWVLAERRADAVVRPVLAGVAQMLRADLPPRLKGILTDLIRHGVQDAANSATATAEISGVLRQGVQGDALTQIIGFLRDTVDQNRATVRGLVRDNSRWWIAARIDRNAADMIVNGLLAVLTRLEQPQSPLRQDFETAAAALLDDPATQGRLRRVLGAAVADYVASDQFDPRAADLLTKVKDRLAQALTEDHVIRLVQETLHQAAEAVAGDAALQARIDAAIADLVAQLIPELRPHAGRFIAQTIKDWDPDLLVDRFETQAGRDLQFIRINGAVLGCVIGGALYGIEHLVG